MIASAQHLHDLHGQHDNTELARFFFRLSDAKIQLTATDDHLPDDVVHAVRMHTRARRNELRNIAADTAEELSRARRTLSARFGRKDAVEIAFKGRRPVNGVVDPLLPVVLPQCRFQCR